MSRAASAFAPSGRAPVPRRPRWIVASILSIILLPAATKGQGATPAPGRVVPSPAECRVAPRSPASMMALITIPHPHRESTFTPTLSATARSSPSFQDGVVADDRTIAGVTVTARENVACLNAGDVLRRFALFTDRGVGQFVQTYGPPSGTESLTLTTTPVANQLPIGQQVALVAVHEIQVRSDGRISATVIQDAPTDPRLGESFVVVFVEDAGRWLIDDIGVLPEPATPTA